MIRPKVATSLRNALRKLFTSVTLAQSASTITIVTHVHADRGAPKRTEVQLNRREWRRISPIALKAWHAYIRWDEAEIIGALQRWADAHEGAPRSSDWTCASVEYPTSNTVRRRFTSWPRTLRLAGLKPANPRAIRRWREDEIRKALQAWTKRGRISAVLAKAAARASDQQLQKGLPPLPNTTPHTLRRTYISIALLANNFDVKWVMAQVGHADSRMTMDVYAQLEQRVKREHGESFDRLVREAGESQAGESLLAQAA